ncbi:hypothetical protein [Streptomyces sp. NPDC053048]|uniref:hypothetical protein n=1 Tax=Streptomyces sp. NPDC053048 TaxID=3365694 RepID=UPI0037CCED4B
MAFYIKQRNPNPLALKPGETQKLTFEVWAEPAGVPGPEAITVQLPDRLSFPTDGLVHYTKDGDPSPQECHVTSVEDARKRVRFETGAIGNGTGGFYYSVPVQAAADAQPGEKTVPGGLSIAGGLTAVDLKILVGDPPPVEKRVYGYINADGTWSGTGFTATKSNAHTFNIKFDEAFMSPPIALATPFDERYNAQSQIGSLGNQSVIVYTSTNTSWAAVRFCFMAVGLVVPKQ